METSKGAVIGFFSLEMAKDQLAARILSERAYVNSEDMRRGKLTNEEFERLAKATREIEETPFFIDDTPALSIAALRTRARRLKRQKNLGVIVVDYLQLLTGSRRNSSDGRVQEISEITRGLKSLAKELNVPVIALSQLSRKVEERPNKRPMLSDLRESGSIEQDADIVLFVYRKEYYLEKEKPEDGSSQEQQWAEEMNNAKGKAEVIAGKNRHGATGTATLSFQKHFTKFGDIAQPDMFPERFE